MANPFGKSRMENYADKFFYWIKTNKDQVLIVLAVCVFFIILIPIIINYNIQAHNERWNKIAQMQSAYYSGNMINAVKIADTVITEKRGSDAAKIAQFSKANALYNMSRFEEAQNVYEDFVKRYKKDYLIPEVLNSLAYCYEMQGKYTEAVETLSKIINEYTDSYLLSNVYDGKARCLELSGDVQGAKEMYQLIINMFPSTPWQKKAQARLNYLLKK